MLDRLEMPFSLICALLCIGFGSCFFVCLMKMLGKVGMAAGVAILGIVWRIVLD
jgi:hypothetical protein